MKEKVAISWSGGKDCTLALYEIVRTGHFEVHSIHTTFNEELKRVGLHGIKQKLIEMQAASLRLRLDKIFISAAEDHNAYEAAMKGYYRTLAEMGVKKVVFGDIFLEDLRAYREKMMSPFGLEGIFPLWKLDSRSVAEKFIRSGFKAVICSADSKYFTESTLGSDYNFDFIDSLSDNVDPCGENGEFHTFVYDGPTFANPISIQRKHVAAKEYIFKVNLPDGNSEPRISKFLFQELD